MSDIDEGDREGDNAYSERDLSTVDVVFQKELDKFVSSSNVEDAVWRAYEVFMTLWADHHRLRTKVQELEGRLETYMKRSAPALSAARMHVPIGGGGSWSWRQQQKDQKERREQAKLKYKEFLLNRTPEQVADDNRMFEELFARSRENRMPDADQQVIGEALKTKRVKRKRSKKTTKRK